ncbi:hypothetical protein DLAC_07146 [Tieghemostelium lacteum]|uniref:Uncharacterized protein n=1 Tax=Tieghemostelium lacteum TaxID=361077 RepID=A0A151ZDA2_TIELA|nr:hypothetical protein DLAC_07146 [Tieghemostelium lacteum]|eukprot:KYQ91911.1 hypothetical protein DLAC_07146 [Tieghemostelium lacteum]
MVVKIDDSNKKHLKLLKSKKNDKELAEHFGVEVQTVKNHGAKLLEINNKKHPRDDETESEDSEEENISSDEEDTKKRKNNKSDNNVFANVPYYLHEEKDHFHIIFFYFPFELNGNHLSDDCKELSLTIEIAISSEDLNVINTNYKQGDSKFDIQKSTFYQTKLPPQTVRIQFPSALQIPLECKFDLIGDKDFGRLIIKKATSIDVQKSISISTKKGT